MIDANQATKIAADNFATKITTYVEKNISPVIENAAKLGKFKACICINYEDGNKSFVYKYLDYIIKYLVTLDFKVHTQHDFEINDDVIIISWEHKRGI